MDGYPKTAVCEKLQGYGCHEGPFARRLRKQATGGHVKGSSRAWGDCGRLYEAREVLVVQ